MQKTRRRKQKKQNPLQIKTKAPAQSKRGEKPPEKRRKSPQNQSLIAPPFVSTAGQPGSQLGSRQRSTQTQSSGRSTEPASHLRLDRLFPRYSAVNHPRSSPREAVRLKRPQTRSKSKLAHSERTRLR